MEKPRKSNCRERTVALSVGMIVEMVNPTNDIEEVPVPGEVKRELLRMYPRAQRITLRYEEGTVCKILKVMNCGWVKVETEQEVITYAPGKYLKPMFKFKQVNA